MATAAYCRLQQPAETMEQKQLNFQSGMSGQAAIHKVAHLVDAGVTCHSVLSVNTLVRIFNRVTSQSEQAANNKVAHLNADLPIMA